MSLTPIRLISLLEYGWLCFMGFLPLLAGEWLILVICQKILWGIRQNLEMLREIFRQFLILQKLKCENLELSWDFLKHFKKVPEDGMSGKSDEEKLGFSYEVLDEYIRTGNISDLRIKEKIDYLHKINLHKNFAYAIV